MNIADTLTCLRFFLCVPLIAAAIYGNIPAFMIIYAIALLTDVLDGYFARRAGSASDRGKHLDILADNFLLLSLAVSVFILRKSLFFLYRWHILSVLMLFVLVQAASVVHKRRLLFMRTPAAQAAAIAFPFAVIGLLFFSIEVFAYIYLLLMYYSLLEKLIITFTEKKHMAGKGLFAAIIVIIIFASIAISQMGESKACFEDGFCVSLEIRDNDMERAIGLMGYSDLPEDKGMLFIFEEPGIYSFWMKNMLIPIDIIFLDKDWKIVHIAKDAKPCRQEPCELFTPQEEAKYVIETKANFSEDHDIQIGQMVYTNGIG